LNHVPAQHGDPMQIGALLDSPQPWVRRNALSALVDYHEKAAPVVDRMIPGLWPPQEPDIRKDAADALQQLSLWAGPALGSIGDRIAQESDPGVRHALVRACWNARESPELPRAVLASLAANDPVDYVRSEAAVTLKASSR
jgi:hypothetical protein